MSLHCCQAPRHWHDERSLAYKRGSLIYRRGIDLSKEQFRTRIMRVACSAAFCSGPVHHICLSPAAEPLRALGTCIYKKITWSSHFDNDWDILSFLYACMETYTVYGVVKHDVDLSCERCLSISQQCAHLGDTRQIAPQNLLEDI